MRGKELAIIVVELVVRISLHADFLFEIEKTTLSCEYHIYQFIPPHNSWLTT